MGKFKDEHGHTRWQEGKKDVRAFLERNPGIAGDILQAVVDIAFPRFSDVVEAIRKVKDSDATTSEKNAVLKALRQLKKDIHEED